MIFGFNTDVRVESTVYHVQSEVREAERLLQTQVFVAGRCIGKRGFSFAAAPGISEISEETKHDLLREQHRWVLGCVRGGSLQDVFDPSIRGPLALPDTPPTTLPPPNPASNDTPPDSESISAASENLPSAPEPAAHVETAEPAAAHRLSLRFVSTTRPDHGSVSLRFQVTDGDANAADAKVAARIDPADSANCSTPLDEASSVTAVTTPDGVAELILAIPSLVSGGASGDACLTVHASTSSGKSCARRFRLRIGN